MSDKESRPASDPNWGAGRLARDWVPKPSSPGMLYDPVSDTEFFNPTEEVIINHGIVERVVTIEPLEGA
jgi:hypothetical protein